MHNFINREKTIGTLDNFVYISFILKQIKKYETQDELFFNL